LKYFSFYSEQEILREEIKSLYAVKARLGQRIQELEEEVKRAREEAEQAAKASKSDDEVRVLVFVWRVLCLFPFHLEH
jgi:uncharacterized protein YlxW (UPF0749 family)